MMERILVVLPNWYGETLFATPFLRALRRRCPHAFIATLGWPQCREVLLRNPHVNERLDYDEHGAHRGLRAKWRLVGTLRANRFDTAFILRRSLSRSCLMALAGIPAQIGFDNAKSGWLLKHGVSSPKEPMHKAAVYLRLLEELGPVPPVGPLEYLVSEEERRRARELLDGASGATHGPLMILHPGANWPHKRWPPERFAALGDRLAASRNARIVITGAPDDRALAESIARQMREPATVLAGRTTLRELGACLEQSRLVISNDTGVTHVAAALATPLVALYGPTAPALTGPLGDPQRMIVLHHPDCCPRIPCYEPDQPPHPGMDAISVDEAYDAAIQLLGEGCRVKGEGKT